jgi:hypothetical protein
MKLREVMENGRKAKEREARKKDNASIKRQKVADEPPAEPAQTAPKLFQNNEFDTIPDQ